MHDSLDKLNSKNKIILLVGALLILVGISGYFLVLDSQKRLIENQALKVAEIVALQASAGRSVYSKTIEGKFKNADSLPPNKDYHNDRDVLPLPAQFLKNVAGKASKDSQGLYKYRPVSKWNLSKEQYLNLDFLKTAWAELEKQDQENPTKAIDWKPVSIVMDFEGKETLLYLKADPASSASCVACHNNYEKSRDIVNRRIEQGIEPRKTWKKHQLLGAIFVQIPIESMQSLALSESTQTMIWIVVILTGGLILLATIILRDVTKARAISQKLFWQAQHDSLTNLPNRNYFEDRTKQLLKSAKRNKETHVMCYLDLDQFKVINDTFGHAAGDQLLCQISKMLQNEIKEPNMIARLGGDEFGILLKDSSIAKANKISQDLCKKIKNFNYIWKNRKFAVAASIGVVAINKDSKNTDDLMKCADLACYAAKEAGRNRVQVYFENDAEMAMREGQMKWVSGILNALEERRVVIFSQKISAIANDVKHTHHEILVRLIGKDGEIILPNEFLPAAERYDLMSKLDLAIIHRALLALKKNYFDDLGDTGFISINLSGQSLSSENFLQKVKFLINHHKVNPKQICFEITESAAISNPRLLQQFMRDMKSVGVRFALDDFGTGLSSLTYIKQFPVDYLKIDGSFITDITHEPIDRNLVDAINKMAHTMGLKTIAEYVESAEILETLRNLGIDYAQGFFVGRPTEIERKVIGI